MPVLQSSRAPVWTVTKTLLLQDSMKHPIDLNRDKEARVCVCVCAGMYIYIYMYMYLSIYIKKYICIYIVRERERQRDRDDKKGITFLQTKTTQKPYTSALQHVSQHLVTGHAGDFLPRVASQLVQPISEDPPRLVPQTLRRA